MSSSDAVCTLCDLPLGTSGTENDEGEPFCCPGCREVHTVLEDRSDVSLESLNVDETREALERNERDERPEGYETTYLRVDGMHCSTCEIFIESVAGGADDISSARASYITDTVRVDHDPATVSEAELCERVSGLGYRAYRRDDPLAETRSENRTMGRIAAGVLFGMMVMFQYLTIIYPTYFGGLFYDERTAQFLADALASGPGTYFFIIIAFLTTLVLTITGGPILKGAYVSLKTRAPNMDLLVAIAALSAYAYSTVAIVLGHTHIYYDVTVAIILVVTIGNYYKSTVKREAMERLSDLTDVTADTVRRYEDDGSTTELDLEELEGGERVLVRGGDRIPVDGVVVEGECTVDEAVITGESMPITKRTGDDVIGGAVVQDGSAVVQVGENLESSVMRLTNLVWNLQSSNHGIQQLADRLATVFVPLVLILAVLVTTVYLLLGGSVGPALLVGLTVLIVSCPCSVGLATPLAIASGVRGALERGIVVFDETVFERLRDVEVLIFDKTGTITTGSMHVVDADGPTDLLELAATLERRSSHPIAEAIAAEFAPKPSVTDGGMNDSFDSAGPNEFTQTDDSTHPTDTSSAADSTHPVDTSEATDSTATDVTNPTPDVADSPVVTDFHSYRTGVGGSVEGTDLLIGHPDLFEEEGWSIPSELDDRVVENRVFGQIPVLVGRNGRAEGIVIVGDEPRDGWDRTISRLHDRGVEIVVLTGDDKRAAAFFEDHPNVDHVFADVPPEGKTETVRRFRTKGTTVMVGDGTNDAPALASADLGIALGSGTALAADAADVAILDDDLAAIETIFDLSNAAGSRVKQNIGWAFFYNGVAIPLAITGLLNPLFAALAMATSSLLVVMNSSRTLLDDE